MRFRVSAKVKEQEMEEIHRELKKYNRANREKSESVPIGVFLETNTGQKKAGLIGEVFGNWLCIRYLWVSGELRGQGIGSELLLKAEKEAARRGARYAFVDTFDFQAPGFYEKRGYRQVFRLADYPYTGSRYYYTKQLRRDCRQGNTGNSRSR